MAEQHQDSLAGFKAEELNEALEKALSRGNIAFAFEGSIPVPEPSTVVEIAEEKAQRELEEQLLLKIPTAYRSSIEDRAISYKNWFDAEKSRIAVDHAGQHLEQTWKRITLKSLDARATNKLESLKPDVSEEEEIRWKNIKEVISAAAKL